MPNNRTLKIARHEHIHMRNAQAFRAGAKRSMQAMGRSLGVGADYTRLDTPTANAQRDAYRAGKNDGYELGFLDAEREYLQALIPDPPC